MTGLSALEFFTAVASAIAGLGTLAAVWVAVAALKTARRAVLLDQLVYAFSDVVAALQLISRKAVQLDDERGGESRSREMLGDAFHAFATARERAGLILPALGGSTAYPDWLMNAATNLAANLLQADEFAQDFTDPSFRPDSMDRPSWVIAQEEWEQLKASISYREVVFLISDLGEPASHRPKHNEKLERWWGENVINSDWTNARSVYGPRASYFVQSARLLDDFTREYVHVGFQDLIKRR